MTADEARNLKNLVWDALSDMCVRLTLWLLTLGPIRAHLCLVPDGHRRFTKDTGTDLRQSYASGQRNVYSVSDWCHYAGILVVSLFGFSIRNFSRNAFEQKAAFEKAIEAVQGIIDNPHKYREMGIGFRGVGDMVLLPQDLRGALARAEIITTNNTKRRVINCEKSFARARKPDKTYFCGFVAKSVKLCTPYSSLHQITLMVQQLVRAVKGGVIRSEDITAELLEDYIMLTESPDVHLLLRTGGDKRFSDFMVLQCSYAYFHLETEKFPQFGFRHWVTAMLKFQLWWRRIEAVKHRHRVMSGAACLHPDSSQLIRQKTFLRRIHAARTPYLERPAGVQENQL